MSDFNSSLPVRTQSNGDVVAFLADGTTSTQLLAISSAGHVSSNLFDGSGTAINSQTISASQWLQVVSPGNGPSSPGTASAFSVLSGGIYHSTPPTLTNGQQSSIQLDSAGRLLVDAAITPNSDFSPATQNITAQDTSSTSTSGANGQQFITGSPTAGSTASFSISSLESVEVQVTGTWTGTLESEFSIDGGTTWFTRGIKQAGASYLSSSFTANFAGGCNITGATNYRIRSIATMTGTATVKIVASLNQASVTVTNPLTLRDATIESITNTIKAASTAALSTDTALVVALSPNTPLPAGTSLLGSVNLDVGSTPVSSTNPVPVYLTSSTPGTSVNYYATSVSLAAGSSANIVYTIPSGKTFTGSKFWMSGSGKIRADVQTSPDGSTYSTFWTAFNSTANPNITIDLNSPVEIQDSGAGATVRVVIKNDDLEAFDVFATISGSYQ